MGAVGTLYASYQQAQAEKAQAQYSADMAGINARMAGVKARDAIRRGDQDAQKVEDKAKQIRGAQRSALAANGVEVNSGSAADEQLDTAQLSEMDVMAVRNNAYREAWGFKAEQSQQEYGAKLGILQGNAKANATLVGGVISAVNQGAQTAAKAFGV